MRKTIPFVAAGLLGCSLTLNLAHAADPRPLRVLLITGGCCHDYAKQKDILKQGLEARANVVVDQIHTDIPAGTSATKPPLPIYGNPDYAKGYDVVIHDECASDINDPAIIKGVLAPHRAGIPGVNLHCANHCYRIGNAGEPAKAGSERALWFDYLGLQSSGHGAQLPIAIRFTDKTHALTHGLGDWITVNEELYNNIQVFPTVKPLARGTQTTKKADGTTKEDDYVAVWVNDYHGTRVFSTTLGHNNATVEDTRYLDLVTRGLLWACGKLDDKGNIKPGYGPKQLTPSAMEPEFSIAPNFFEQNPDGKPLGPCHGGVVLDKAGNIYVTTDTARGIVVFSPAGKFLRTFGPTRIHGLELREENGVEYIYAARPSDHEVVKLKLDGTSEWTIHFPKEAGIHKDENGFKPCAVTVAPDGSIFVADGYGSNFVLKFDKDGKFVKAFGGPGAEEGKFNTCHGIALDTRQGKPLLLICNRNNNRVEHWDLDGNFVRVIQKDLRMPAAVHIRGDFAVFPELQGRVTVLNKAGSIVARVGDNPIPGQRANYGLPQDQWKDGICNSPHGASIDKDGNLIVSEWSQFGHLHKFTRAK